MTVMGLRLFQSMSNPDTNASRCSVGLEDPGKREVGPQLLKVV
jgi:hypothetical protein